MGILDLARADYRHILGNVEDFSLSLSFVSPLGVEAEIVGHGMSHHISFGTDGQVVNSKNTHVTFAEKDLAEAGYTVRDADNKVALYHHFVSFANHNGFVQKYNVIQVYPDEALGLIVLSLSENSNG